VAAASAAATRAAPAAAAHGPTARSGAAGAGVAADVTSFAAAGAAATTAQLATSGASFISFTRQGTNHPWSDPRQGNRQVYGLPQPGRSSYVHPHIKRSTDTPKQQSRDIASYPPASFATRPLDTCPPAPERACVRVAQAYRA
jgi:hypothetical protein